MYIRCLALLLVAQLTSISGQSIKPHVLCEDDNITVTAGSSGIITYTKRDNNRPCTLILSGFNSDSRVSIPGVDRLSGALCLFSDASLTINNVVYCVEGSDSPNTAVVLVPTGYLNITLPSADVPQFTITYYNNGKQTRKYIVCNTKFSNLFIQISKIMLKYQ